MNAAPARHWLVPARIRLYSALFLAFFLLFSAGFIGYSNLGTPGGYPIVSDLTVFWAASKLALSGQPIQAYLVDPLRAVVMQLDPAVKGTFGWFYPPNFFLLILPLSWLPYYLPAYLTFMVPTLGLYVYTVRRILWNREAAWALAAFPGIWLNLLRGQNGLLTAGLAGLALVNLEKRPLLSGVLIGLLSIKPQLIVLFPVALVAVGAWSTLVLACLTTLATMVAGMAVLGVGTLPAWLESLEQARLFTELNGADYWVHMPTIFACFRLLGAPVALAYAAQLIASLVGAGAVWWVWRRPSVPELRFSTLVTATFLVSPYLLEYDLAWLALPLAWMTLLGLKSGWLKWEREVMVLTWLLPLAAGLIARQTSFQIGPWVILLMLGLPLRRTWYLRSRD